MSNQFKIVIPARFSSSRLEGKVLLPVAGKTMLQHVWERCSQSGAGEIVVATDDSRVADTARGFGADVCITSANCHSGTDRVAEVCDAREWSEEAPVVNVQGDAPLIPPASIARVADLLIQHPGASVATLCTPLCSVDEYVDPHVVKVVFDNDGRALYFSRSPIPAAGHGNITENVAASAYRHLGLYAYRPGALRVLSQTEPCKLEKLERLEQLRALWLGMEIRIAVDSDSHGPDVDTIDDLEKVKQLIADQNH